MDCEEVINKKAPVGLFCLENVYELLSNDVVIETCLALGSERNYAVLESKEGIVLTNPDVLAWESICAALAENDLANSDLLAMVDLNP
jgi:hypothetical protein